MNYENLKARWPKETPTIIGAIPKRRKDYGSETPVSSFRQSVKNAIKKQFSDEDNRIEALAVLGVCLVVGLCLVTLFHVMPDAIDGLIEHQRQIAMEAQR